jgi:hypothetical protein
MRGLLRALFWRSFSVGVAPLVLGEYVGAIHTQIQHRPFAIELDRMNFEHPPQVPPAQEPLQQKKTGMTEAIPAVEAM